MAIETPEYKLLKKHGKIEIREYQSMAVAVTWVQQPYNPALNEGFRRIASYIFGGKILIIIIGIVALVLTLFL